MKNLRRLSIAVAFTFALAVPTFAGQIDTPVAPPPTPATQGEIHTGITAQTEETAATTGSATQAALDILQSVLSLF